MSFWEPDLAGEKKGRITAPRVKVEVVQMFIMNQLEPFMPLTK